jgi:hypothetical protein
MNLIKTMPYLFVVLSIVPQGLMLMRGYDDGIFWGAYVGTGYKYVISLIALGFASMGIMINNIKEKVV